MAGHAILLTGHQHSCRQVAPPPNNLASLLQDQCKLGEAEPLFLSIYVSIYLCIYLFIYVSIYLSIYLYIRPLNPVFPLNDAAVLVWTRSGRRFTHTEPGEAFAVKGDQHLQNVLHAFLFVFVLYFSSTQTCA